LKVYPHVDHGYALTSDGDRKDNVLDCLRLIGYKREVTALPAAMRYILKAESDDRRGVRRKLYCIIAGSAVSALL
jgi:hypothetical protein